MKQIFFEFKFEDKKFLFNKIVSFAFFLKFKKGEKGWRSEKTS